MSSTAETSLGNPLVEERLPYKHSLRFHPIPTHLSYDVGGLGPSSLPLEPPGGCCVMWCAYTNATHNGGQYQIRNPQASNSGQSPKFPCVVEWLYKTPSPPKKKKKKLLRFRTQLELGSRSAVMHVRNCICPMILIPNKHTKKWSKLISNVAW